MRETLGTRLRQQREARRITIESIASSTRISGGLFVGLERDDVTGWPGGIYRRSFIRAYAEAIGLDPDAVCREFVEQFPETQPGLTTTPLAIASPLSAHLGEWERMLATPKDRLETAEELLQQARLPNSQSLRWRAVTFDLCGLVFVAVLALALFDRFWGPLAGLALCYALGGTLLLGKSPSLWWLERRAGDSGLAEAATLGQTAPLP